MNVKVSIAISDAEISRIKFDRSFGEGCFILRNGKGTEIYLEEKTILRCQAITKAELEKG